MTVFGQELGSCFWSDIGSGFGEPGHPRQEFLGVPPLSSLDLYEVSEKSLLFQYK